MGVCGNVIGWHIGAMSLVAIPIFTSLLRHPYTWGRGPVGMTEVRLA